MSRRNGRPAALASQRRIDPRGHKMRAPYLTPSRPLPRSRVFRTYYLALNEHALAWRWT